MKLTEQNVQLTSSCYISSKEGVCFNPDTFMHCKGGNLFTIFVRLILRICLKGNGIDNIFTVLVDNSRFQVILLFFPEISAASSSFEGFDT